jgi:hypothetical protein
MANFKAPDLNAPRFRKKEITVLNSNIFKEFLKKHPKYKGQVDLKSFRKVITKYNENLKNAVIDNRDGIELPQNLGYLVVTKCERPKKGTNINYAATIKSGKYVNHRNWDSDNYLAKICYSNYSLKYRFSDRELWAFTPDKKFRQNVSKAFPELYNKYIHLTSKTRIYQLYKNV